MTETIHLLAVEGPRQGYRTLFRQEEKVVEEQAEPSAAVWALRRSWLVCRLQGIVEDDRRVKEQM